MSASSPAFRPSSHRETEAFSDISMGDTQGAGAGLPVNDLSYPRPPFLSRYNDAMAGNGPGLRDPTRPRQGGVHQRDEGTFAGAFVVEIITRGASGPSAAARPPESASSPIS